MPFKSQAQRRKFAELLVAGKISPQTYEEWNRETGKKRLPERVKRARRRERQSWRKERRRRSDDPFIPPSGLRVRHLLPGGG
jgi:hypothetical protein